MFPTGLMLTLLVPWSNQTKVGSSGVVEAFEQVSNFLRGAGRKVWNMGRAATYGCI